MTVGLTAGKRVFWHSSAHVLGEAAERHYGCHLCIGPPTDDGFFYEMAIEDRPVSSTDYPVLEKISDGVVKEKQKFERLVVSKEILLEMFGVSVSSIATSSVLSRHRSITNTKNILLNLKFRTGRPPRSIAAVPWLTYVSVPTFRILERSRHSW